MLKLKFIQIHLNSRIYHLNKYIYAKFSLFFHFIAGENEKMSNENTLKMIQIDQ